MAPRSSPRAARAHRWQLAAIATCLAFGVARQAGADDVNKQLADALFSDGRRLMKEGKYQQACRKFEASQRLDPAAGTKLNLAACHELEGKLATALIEFKESLAQAKKDGRADRVEVADQHLRDLAGKVPEVTIVVPPDAPKDLIVKWDDVVLPQDALSIPLPADPGAHAIVVSAPGFATWTGSTKALAPGEKATVMVPRLDKAEPTPVAQAATATAVVAEKPSPRKEPPPIASPEPRSAGRARWAIASLTVGGVALGTGAYLFFHARSLRADAEDAYAAVHDDDARSLNDSASRWRTWSAVAGGVGVAAIASGVVLLVTGDDTKSKDGAKMGLLLPSGGVGLQWAGSF